MQFFLDRSRKGARTYLKYTEHIKRQRERNVAFARSRRRVVKASAAVGAIQRTFAQDSVLPDLVRFCAQVLYMASSPIEEGTDNAELVLFQAKECYVYLIPPRRSAASYRADEWNINKWDWEGSLKVVSRGTDCTINLVDNTSGELYAQASVQGDQPLPIEAVIDSSRFFVLRVEDSSGPQVRHAFIGIGFREREPAYDFQAALHDHVKYVMKKKQAEESVQEYESKPSVDYSLKEGETLHLTLKPSKAGSAEKATRSKFFNKDQDSVQKSVPFVAPPPNPSFPVSLFRAVSNKVKDLNDSSSTLSPPELQENFDDDFGDFQSH